MEIRFNGKTAIVTGSGGGIVRVIARTLAQAGANVVIADLNEKAGTALAEELCAGRLVITLEGGYHLDALSYSVLNTFAVLLGVEGWQVVDPLGPSRRPERSVDDMVERVRQAHGLTHG